MSSVLYNVENNNNKGEGVSKRLAGTVGYVIQPPHFMQLNVG